ncbi:MAG TPA: metallophosphoesterase family protein [Candidatus Hydrogenedentes bacterium]|nr:metallophosphoesterase family protein [Candidatus Hydrogenedentota bacterium]HOS01973.1 metallophosphoesterase family protein [Candidatus Hydrogenedentota bacterium]
MTAKRRTLYTLIALIAVFAVVRIIDEFKGAIIASVQVRATQSVASASPDQIALSWSDDPQTTQTVQWRTAPSVLDGWVQVRATLPSDASVTEMEAERSVMRDRLLRNDPVNHRYTAVLRGLTPGTSYQYRVGSKQRDLWSSWNEFTTGPESAEDFSFLFLGDPQVDMKNWGALLRSAHERHPQAAFYLLAGDIVDNGTFRNLWDEYFRASQGVFDRRPAMAALGNHDYSSRWNPSMFLHFFPAPHNGPKALPTGHAYSFTYGNALFVVLDSNQEVRDQTPWIEQQLAQTKATWKFALFHHPVYSSKDNRDNEEVRDHWKPIFDQYHLDMALQGHDHAYLRTYPMRNDKRATADEGGVYYVVAVSGTKFYKQEPHDYAEIGFENTPTYQVIDIATNPNRFTYRAYDAQGNVKDEVILVKP